MRRFVFGLCVGVMCVCGLTSVKGQGDFEVTFEQDGKVVKRGDYGVTLRRAPFDIVFEFPQPMGILVNGSFKVHTYAAALRKKPMSDLAGFESTGMAEGLLNSDLNMYLSSDSPCYWFYETHTQNRFNHVIRKSKRLICKRTIRSVVDIDSGVTTLVEDMKHPLYLVFISTVPIEDSTVEAEGMRDMVKISWSE